MWRKVIKKNFKKGLHKNINKVKISKDQAGGTGCTEGTSPATLTQRWRLVPGGADAHEGQKELGRGGRRGCGRFPATAIAAGGAGGGSVLSQRARRRMTRRVHSPSPGPAAPAPLLSARFGLAPSSCTRALS